MSTCEKCWRQSDGDPARYRDLLEENTCTPEEQAGHDANLCSICSRKTLHQFTNKCMNKDCDSRKPSNPQEAQ